MKLNDLLIVLKNYRCQYTQDDEGDGMALVDMLTPPDDVTIERGVIELELLAEHIFYELLAEEE